MLVEISSSLQLSWGPRWTD